MSLAELCKSTAKKAKEKERNDAIKTSLEIDIIDSPEEEIKPKPRIGPHTPPLPREPSSPRITPEPSSTADFYKSYFQDEREGRHRHHHHHHHHHHHRRRYASSSRSPSPVDSYRSHGGSRSYSVGSTRSHGNATSTTSCTAIPSYEPIGQPCYRDDSYERERQESVTGTRTVSPPPLETKRRTPEKKPYFTDQKREKDRLRRKYGEEYVAAISPKRSRSSPEKMTAYYMDEKRENHRLFGEEYAHRSLSRSKSPVSHGVVRHRSSGPEIHLNERYRHLSPMSERHLLQRRRGFPRSRSRSHERRMAMSHPPTQIITIPVAVPPDCPYAFTSWPPQWGPFPLNSLLPSSSMPPIRTPFGLPLFNPNIFRPQQRYPHARNFGPRPLRGPPFPPTRNP